MAAKHQFYKNRDGNDFGRQRREEVWRTWNGQLGDCGDGIIAKVGWELPDIVKRAFDSLGKITIG